MIECHCFIGEAELQKEEAYLYEEAVELEAQEDGLQEDELQRDGPGLLQSGTMKYQTRDRFFIEQGLFQANRSIFYPGDLLFFLFKDQPFVSVFSHQEFFADEETSKEGLLAFPFQEVPSSPVYRWFIKKRQERHFEFLIRRERSLRTNSSLSNGFFRSKTLSESYEYLSNLFLCNGRLLDQTTKNLLRKGWIFPDEMKIGFM